MSVVLPAVLPLANDVGLNVPVLAPGSPVTLNVTSLASVPPCVATVMVNVADPPAATVCSPVGELTVKSLMVKFCPAEVPPPGAFHHAARLSSPRQS